MKISVTNTNFVWIDLEMTGLNPVHDVILEIACIITDDQLTMLKKGPSLVIHQPESTLKQMDEWPKNQHTISGLIQEVRQSTISVTQAEEQVQNFLNIYCAPGTGLLAGNSVWQDRMFLKKYMPKIIDFLHYRLIDVTTVKELVSRWYPHSKQAEFVKKDTHRAFEDVQESIKELRYYRKYFFVM